MFNTSTNRTDTIKVRGGIIASQVSGRLYYEPTQNRLISYNINTAQSSFFSFENNSWSNSVKDETDYTMNNSVVYDSNSSSLISFGGYSQYKYNNTIRKVNPYEQTTQVVTLADIDPRYSTALTIKNNTLYIFGGRGCKSGRQELSPHNYYDLYTVNLSNWETSKIWESELFEEFLPSENMIYDEENKCFYLLSNNAPGCLLKLDTTQKTFERISLPVNTSFAAQYLYTNLYYSPKQGVMYALIYRTDKDKSEVEIYSLPYPPIPLSVLTQDGAEEIKEEESSIMLYALISIAIVGILTSVIYLYRRTKEKHGVSKTKAEPQIDSINTDQQFVENVQYYDFSKSCICLLGGFMIKDKDGNDITELFTPTLKHLLILILLFMVQNPRGIASSKLIQYLWSDRSEESAKNNRNVYLSKLRILIEKIGNVELINKNSFWTIQCREGALCDYIEAMNYFSEIKEKNDQSQESLYKLQELLLRGTLLPNTEIDWIDNFKSSFSNLTLDILYELSLQDENNLDDDYKLKIADTIFLHDFINEEALYIKCSILYKNGKKGIAKNVYDNFCREYANLMGTGYKFSLSEVIHKEMR